MELSTLLSSTILYSYPTILYSTDFQHYNFTVLINAETGIALIDILFVQKVKRKLKDNVFKTNFCIKLYSDIFD